MLSVRTWLAAGAVAGADTFAVAVVSTVAITVADVIVQDAAIDALGGIVAGSRCCCCRGVGSLASSRWLIADCHGGRLFDEILAETCSDASLFAETRLIDAAKGDLGGCGAATDVESDVAGLELLKHAPEPRRISGKDVRRESHICIVGFVKSLECVCQ